MLAPLLRGQLNRLACLRKPGKKLFEALSVGVRCISNAIDGRKSMSANGAMRKIVSCPCAVVFRRSGKNQRGFTLNAFVKRLRDVAVAM